MTNAQAITSGRFDIAQVAATFPASAKTLLVDQYLTNRPEASARLSCLQTDAAALSRHVRRISVCLLRPRHFLDGRPGHEGGVPTGAALVLPERDHSRDAGPAGRADRVPLGRYAASRSQRHHLRQSRGWHAGDLHWRELLT